MGSRAVRGLVKAKGKVIDSALDELIATGMVERRKEGRGYRYVATSEGMDVLENDVENAADLTLSCPVSHPI